MEPTTPQLGKLIHRMVPSSCSVRIYARLSSDRSIHGSNVGRTDCDCLTDQTFIRSSENLCTASHDSVCLTPYRAKKFHWFRFKMISHEILTGITVTDYVYLIWTKMHFLQLCQDVFSFLCIFPGCPAVASWQNPRLLGAWMGRPLGLSGRRSKIFIIIASLKTFQLESL